MKRIFFTFLVILISTTLWLPFLVFSAQHTLPPSTGPSQPLPPSTGPSQPLPPSGPFELTNPIQSRNFAEIMQRVAKIAIQIGLPLVAIFMIYSGFLFVSARGNEEQLKKAKNTFFWAVIGALLVVGAFAIATAIQQFARQL